MASDVTLELLDREEVMTVECEQDLTMDQLLVSMVDICHISPVARGLFAFKQFFIFFMHDCPHLFPSCSLVILCLPDHLDTPLSHQPCVAN